VSNNLTVESMAQDPEEEQAESSAGAEESTLPIALSMYLIYPIQSIYNISNVYLSYGMYLIYLIYLIYPIQSMRST